MFQDGIWSVCFNVVVCTRIQRRKKREFKEQKKKKIQKKKKCQKEENKKGSHQILRSEMEGRSTTLKKKSWKKKMLNENSKKSWHSDKSWKHFLLFTFTHFYFIPFAFTLHYVLIKSLFDLEDCVVQILIWLRRKRCGMNIFGILSWDYLFFLD